MMARGCRSLRSIGIRPGALGSAKFAGRGADRHYSRRACRVALPVRAISRCDVSRLLSARAGSKEADGDLMGDGVNIAARLEGIAAPGAICLSEDAYRQVKARLDLAVTDLGPTQLKNIAEP